MIDWRSYTPGGGSGGRHAARPGGGWSDSAVSTGSRARPIAPAWPMHPSVPATMQPSELAEMLSSLRLKEVLRDQSLSNIHLEPVESLDLSYVWFIHVT